MAQEAAAVSDRTAETLAGASLQDRLGGDDVTDQEILFLAGIIFSACAMMIFCGWYIRRGHQEMQKCCVTQDIQMGRMDGAPAPQGQRYVPGSGRRNPWDSTESVSTIQAMHAFQFGDASSDPTATLPQLGDSGGNFPANLLAGPANPLAAGQPDPARRGPARPAAKSSTKPPQPTQVKSARSRDPEFNRDLAYQKDPSKVTTTSSLNRPASMLHITRPAGGSGYKGSAFPTTIGAMAGEFHREDTGMTALSTSRSEIRPNAQAYNASHEGSGSGSGNGSGRTTPRDTVPPTTIRTTVRMQGRQTPPAGGRIDISTPLPHDDRASMKSVTLAGDARLTPDMTSTAGSANSWSQNSDRGGRMSTTPQFPAHKPAHNTRGGLSSGTKYGRGGAIGAASGGLRSGRKGTGSDDGMGMCVGRKSSGRLSDRMSAASGSDGETSAMQKRGSRRGMTKEAFAQGQLGEAKGFDDDYSSAPVARADSGSDSGSTGAAQPAPVGNLREPSRVRIEAGTGTLVGRLADVGLD